jgi:hypothetical protein
MRTRLATGTICALLVAAFSVPVNAQAPTSTVTDPNGRYTIRFPQSWQVVSMNANPVAGEIANQLDKNFFSMLMAVDPGAPSAAPTVLMVMSMELPTAISPRTFGLMTQESMGEKFKQYTLVQEGTATIAQRPAFYRYFTMVDKDGDEFYGVMAFFTVAKTGYVIFGLTQNNPLTVRRSFGEVSRVLETFHPTGK